MKIVCVNTPRKFIMAKDRDRKVVAKPPIAKGAYSDEDSMLVCTLHPKPRVIQGSYGVCEISSRLHGRLCWFRDHCLIFLHG
jgi:hypothetical protein